MKFVEYLKEQLYRHPSAGPQDIIKQCYQASHGAEHLLADTSRAWNYLKSEYEEIMLQSEGCGASCCDEALYEAISDEVARINLAAWKKTGWPLEWLFAMFVGSASIREDAKETLVSYLEEADAFVKDELEGWSEFLAHYKEIGMPAMHHSEGYRQAEHPAYRIVNSKCLRLIPILKAVYEKMNQKENGPLVLVIDGRAASGKSTMGEQLKAILGADLIHMDDFFLPPALRSPERFGAPGGNVHYERFAEEVLPYVALEDAFSYRIFDCSQMDYNGCATVTNSKVRIVEGSYSMHPAFGDYGDLRVFSQIDPKEQMQRIRIRNGERLAARFEKEWIPMEEMYFDQCKVRESADIIL